MIRKNYIIDIRPEEQAATIIDLKLKVVVEVTIEDNIVKNNVRSNRRYK